MQDHSSGCRWAVMQAYKYLINKWEGGKEGGRKEGENKNNAEFSLSVSCSKFLQDLQCRTFSRLRRKGTVFQKCRYYLIYFKVLMLYFLSIFPPKMILRKYLPSWLIIQISSTHQFIESNKLHHHISKPQMKIQALYK